MTTMDISLNQVDEHIKRLQEIKMFLESALVKPIEKAPKKIEMNLVIHEYWKK